MGVIDDDQTMKKKLQQQQQQQRSSSSTTTATSSSTPYLRRDRGGLELPARSSSAAESTNDVSQQRAFDFEEVPTFWSACDELAQTLTEFEQNQKQAQHALSSYVIENCEGSEEERVLEGDERGGDYGERDVFKAELIARYVERRPRSDSVFVRTRWNVRATSY